MKRGYLKIWRKSIESAVFQDPDLWKLWCLCLLKASYKEKKVLLDGTKQAITIMPGQFITGRFSLHRDYYQNRSSKNVSPITLWRWLKSLETVGNLNIKTTNKHSVITINNWDQYQCDEQQMNNKRTTDEQQMITNKNSKERKKVKNTTFNPFSVRPDWFPEKDFADLVSHRKNHPKKPAQTERAYTALIKQIEIATKNGHTVTQCVDMITSRSWAGFDASWMDNSKNKRNHLDEYAMELLNETNHRNSIENN